MNRLHTILKIKSYNEGILTLSEPRECFIGNRIILTDHKNKTLDTLIVGIISETEIILYERIGEMYSNYVTAIIAH